MARKSPYSPELRRRAVRMVGEVRSQYKTDWAAITAVAEKLGIGTAETLHSYQEFRVSASPRAIHSNRPAASGLSRSRHPCSAGVYPLLCPYRMISSYRKNHSTS